MARSIERLSAHYMVVFLGHMLDALRAGELSDAAMHLGKALHYAGELSSPPLCDRAGRLTGIWRVQLERLTGRCDCSAQLKFYAGAGVGGLLCPVCDHEHAEELSQYEGGAR